MPTDRNPPAALIRHEPRPVSDLPGAPAILHHPDAFVCLLPREPRPGDTVTFTCVKHRAGKAEGPLMRFSLPQLRGDR